MARKPLSIIDLFSVDQPYVTEFRRLLHRIRRPENGADLKSVLVTSAMLSEGKSTIASFLAMTAALKKDFKTLLVDADLRRPSIHKFFGLKRAIGLAEIITEKLNAADTIKKTPVETLHILTAGRSVLHPAEVFNADVIGNVISEMKFYYDFIVVDSPPVLPVSDPMLLASQVDGLMLVVKAGATQKEVVERAIGILDIAKHRMLGVILNNLNNSLPYQYDYRYYGYDYAPENDTPEKPAASRRGGRKRLGRRPGTDGKAALIVPPIKQP